MLYIKIPDGMEYRAVPTQNKLGESIVEDRFVSITGEGPDLSIQEAVNAFYHATYQKNKNAGEAHGLSFYKKKPLSCNTRLLEYRANDSGRSPTYHAVTIETNRSSTATSLPVGRWINHTLLSPKRHEEAAKKEEAQKYNRRKWGDSPNAN